MPIALSGRAIRTYLSRKHRGVRLAIGALFAVTSGLAAPTPAAAQMPLRVGIVYSAPSADHFYDRFAYNQLFMAMQHQAMMAGIPFDLLDESHLTDISRLAGYRALIIPSMQYVTASRAAAIHQTLLQATTTYGVGLMVSGAFMTNTEKGALRAGDPFASMVALLGVSWQNSVYGSAADVRAANVSHPVTRTYTNGELIRHYDQIWTDIYQPAGQRTATTLATITAGSRSYNGALALDAPGSRHVHFANDQVLGDSNLAWSALQWMVYGNQPAVALKMGRDTSLFVSRTDMDLSMYAESVAQTAGPFLDLVASWKRQYGFVGSYFINIGNQPKNGETTNWNVSGPLYSAMIALGNEIGTHSWTHPHETSLLKPTQLEFEFNQSKLEIGRRLGVPVVGAAIPGMPESLAVDDQIQAYFRYISGRSGVVGSGYPGAFGRMRPNSTATYLSLNMSPDFTLVDWLGYTPAQAEQIWAAELAGVRHHASQPIVHWMWHDYGLTAYSEAMVTNTIGRASATGAEFLTSADLDQRMRTFTASGMTVSGANPVNVSVAASEVGTFSLQLGAGQRISRVTNWYAYDDDQVFLPDGGGQFGVHIGTTPADVTRITKLPMRARLLSVTGDGTTLSFTLRGEGAVTVQLSSAVSGTVDVTGADSVTRSGQTLSLRFDQDTTHTVVIGASGGTINSAPSALAQSVTATSGVAVALVLGGTDPEGASLTYAITTQPTRGTLTGTAPNVTYTSNAGYAGPDSFAFTVNDGSLTSAPATVSVSVTAPPVVPPTGLISNRVSSLTVDANLADWTALTPFASDPNDVTGTKNRIDWLQARAAHSSTDLYLAYQNDGALVLSWGLNVYLDTDANSATGFRNGGQFGVGAEYLLQGVSLYRYTGDGSTWKWTAVSTATAAISGSNAEFRIPLSQIGTPKRIHLFLFGENAAYSGGSGVDLYPDGATNAASTTRYLVYSLD